MLSSLPVRRRPLLLTGALAILSAACSTKDAEQRPAVESAASAPAASRSTETTSSDTTSAPSAPSSTPGDTAQPAAPRPAQASTAGTAKRTQPPVKPSIDPGRKAPSTGPRPIVTPGAAPADSAAQAHPSSAAVDSPTKQSAQEQPLQWDSKSKTATFQLIGGPSGFQFNGYSSGGATLILLPNINVVMNFINKDGTPHSAEVISGEGPLPNQGVDAAIPRAYTNQLLQGLPQEGTDVIRFTAPASGTYRIFCGVPGHGLSGMWIWVKIDPAAKEPSFGPTKS